MHMLAHRCLLIVGLWACLCALGCATSSPSAVTPAAPPPQPSIRVGETTVLAIAPPAAACCKKQTLPEFLGLTQLGRGIGRGLRGLSSRIAARLDLAGRFPGLQPGPPMLAITDPANLAETASPSVKAAAEVKAEQDAAPQKIQALRYLATIGCGGCYPSVESALLAALDDCTETVRYEAALALRGTNTACGFCNSDSCCSPNVRRKLHAIAFDIHPDGCLVESSERVRRLARLALDACGGYSGSSAPDEGPTLPDEPIAVQSPTPPDESSLSETIQLASFVDDSGARQPHDILLAQVNGEAIFESQVAPLAEAELALLGSNAERATGDKHDQYRAVMKKHLDRLIESRLLVQMVRDSLESESGTEPPLPTIEQVAAWVESQLELDEQPSADAVARYYHQHLDEFTNPARLRWEQVTIRIASFPTREQAHAAISYVHARARGLAASPPPGFDPRNVEVRTHGWINQSDLPATTLASKLSKTPVGQLSPIVEEGAAFHLTRVLEKKPAEKIALAAASERIREKLMKDQRQQAEQRLLARLRNQARIWTVFAGTVPEVTSTIVKHEPEMRRDAPARDTAARHTSFNREETAAPTADRDVQVTEIKVAEPEVAEPTFATTVAAETAPPVQFRMTRLPPP